VWVAMGVPGRDSTSHSGRIIGQTVLGVGYGLMTKTKSGGGSPRVDEMPVKQPDVPTLPRRSRPLILLTAIRPTDSHLRGARFRKTGMMYSG
jgi:hypothetical protein